MTSGATDMVILGTWIGVSVLALLVVLPLLVMQCVGFRGCLQCGSELNDGAGKCLMCSQVLRTPRRVLYEWIHRVCQMEEPSRPETASVGQEEEKRSEACGF